jgi:PPIC-type PPIASE domain
MKRTLFIAATAAIALTACSGLKDAFSAHSGVVARAGSFELTATQLADYVAHSRAPANREVAQTIANLWVDYRLLAEAAVNGDSLTNPKELDEAMWPIIANLKARKWYEILAKNWGTENPAAAQADYASGKLLSAQHILLLTPAGMADSTKARLKKKAEALRAQATGANFAALATANSQDPASSKIGGSLGVFTKGQMVPAFEKALLALKPGEISGVVTTQYGYHIIRRATYDEVKAELLEKSKGASLQAAESTYLARIEATGDISIKSSAVSTMHAIGTDPAAYQNDNTVLATSKAGKFTAARLVGWAQTFPPQARVFQQMKTSPDSVLLSFLRNLVKNELVLRQADSAKIQPESLQLAQMRINFTQTVEAAWRQLGIGPSMLADSAKTKKDQLALAGRRLDDYFNKLVLDIAPFVQLPTPVVDLLRKKYDYSVNQAGLDRAVELAVKIRATPQPTGPEGVPPSTAVPLGPTASSTAPSTPPSPGR